MASSKQFKSRDDWKKEKELEEARKAGTVAPLQDDEGNDINPHIPQYIAQAPWYLKRNAPSLKHQRIREDSQAGAAGINEWYARGATAGPAARKYRKGACTNCGAMTHQAKDCCERPRKKGAKWTNDDIKPDEVVRDLELSFDGKRDRWNGYDADMHSEVMQKYNHLEELRRKIKTEDLASKLVPQDGEEAERAQDGEDSDSDKEGGIGREEEDFKDSSSVLQTKDPKTRTTIRNLRIREDTAKYLRNLALDSAYYDPKTRSMRENPNPNADPTEQTYLGDNWVRRSGQVADFSQQQWYAWEASEKGQEIHMLAAPSQAELLFNQFKQKKDELKNMQKNAVLRKYGGEEHLDSLPRELIYAQTESYVEYTRDGRVANGKAGGTAHAVSKYEEDVHAGNHTSVWGSYWENGEWGYACCKQLVRNSYCTGAAGRAAKESLLQEMRQGLAAAERQQQEQALAPRGKKTKEQRKKEKEEKEERLKKAIDDEARRSKTVEEKDERKRRYNAASGETYEVTEEEMEAYRLKRHRRDDPMRDFLSTEDGDENDASKEDGPRKKRARK